MQVLPQLKSLRLMYTIFINILLYVYVRRLNSDQNPSFSIIVAVY